MADKVTERDVLDALRARYASGGNGNGPAWAYVEHVRDKAGFSATRTIDAIALDLWPSRGMELHGLEVKTSRADFRREIADPAKMDAFAAYLDRFWVVAPVGIVPVDELPSTWGLLELISNGTIRQKVPAPLLRKTRVEIPRTFLVPLLRSAGAVLERTPNEQAEKDAFDRGHAAGKESAGYSAEQWEKRAQRAEDALKVSREAVVEIDRALGSSIEGHVYDDLEKRRAKIAEVAGAVKTVLAAGDTVKQAENAIRRALQGIENTRGQLEVASQWITRETGVDREKS